MAVAKLTDPESKLTVEVVTAAGDITVRRPLETTVLYPRRGPGPFVTNAPVRAATPVLPELMFRDDGAYGTLVVLHRLGRRLILTLDTGERYPVKFVGDLVTRTVDTPDRAKNPLRFVAVEFVGVA